MLKRLTFTARNPSVPPREFGLRWQSDAHQMLERLPRPRAPPVGALPGPPRTDRPTRRRGHRVVRGRPGNGWLRRLAGCPAQNGWGDAAATPALSMVVEERPVHGDPWLRQRWNDPRPPPAPLLIGCIEAAEAFSRQEFRDYWWERHRPLADRLVPSELRPVAYVHDYVRPGEPGPWAGIGELYERSLDVAARRGAWFESEDAAALVQDERRFFLPTTRRVLVTDQIVIKSG